jgi:hypothetical protein
MKRTIRLKELGATYVCKAAFFTYAVNKGVDQKIELGPDEDPGLHAITLVFPRNLKKKTQIVDCHFEDTDPYRRMQDHSYAKADMNQVGKVKSLFYVRANHPSALKRAAEQRADHYKVKSLNQVFQFL